MKKEHGRSRFIDLQVSKKEMQLGENEVRIVKNVELCKLENCAMLFERE